MLDGIELPEEITRREAHLALCRDGGDTIRRNKQIHPIYSISTRYDQERHTVAEWPAFKCSSSDLI